VAEKIVHPINYGYFSKTQPRQRFFLDKDRMAVTNQCIYLTSNKLLQHDTPMVYFLTLLNSSTLQFFVLENCKYDQQGRMRLFRELMASIPFQDWDVKHNPGRVQYASQLGDLMMELKEIIYSVVSAWHLTGGHQSQGGGTSSNGASTSNNNQTLLDWIRRGGDPPAGVLEKTKNQVQKMLMTTAGTMTLTHSTPYTSQSPSPSISSMIRSSSLLAASFADTDTDHSTGTDTDVNTDADDRVEARTPPTIQEHIAEDQGAWMVDDRGYTMQEMGSSGSDLRHATDYRRGSVATSGSDTPSTTSSSLPSLPSHNVVTFNNISNERDRIMQAIEQVIAMIEILQWAVDQYGYMLYGIQPMIQRLLEQELKLVYGSVVTALVEPSSSVNDVSSGPMPGLEPLLDRTTTRMPTQAPRNEDQKRPLIQPSENTVSRLGITITGLHRWGDYNEDEDLGHVMKNNHLDPSTPVGLGHAQIPSYALSLVENAQAAAQSLREFLERYSGSRS